MPSTDSGGPEKVDAMPSERVVGMLRNEWTASIGIDGRHEPDYAAEGKEWYKAMPFVCAALARHIYHCLKFNEPYDVGKAFQGLVPAPASEEDWLDLREDLDHRFEEMEVSLCQIEA